MHKIQLATAFIASALLSVNSNADQVILDDSIVAGSLCAGQDCVNGESFGFDTLRLKENNLRIRAVDTSSTASFPSRDWQITFNDSSNGGANKFSIDDIDGGKTPFTLEAGAPSHSLYVDDGGRLGLGTSTPIVQIHLKDGNTPTLRLEQDGSSGFTPQTWDVAGNEANFFVRDATNGSQLPLQIKPGADTGSLLIKTDNSVNVKKLITTESANINTSTGGNILTADAVDTLTVENTNATTGNRLVMALKNNGPTGMAIADTSGDTWYIVNGGSGLAFYLDTINAEGLKMRLNDDGSLDVKGAVNENGL